MLSTRRPAPDQRTCIRPLRAAIRALFAVFLFTVLSISHGLEAWVYHPERASGTLPMLATDGALIVLDADQWSRQEILDLRRQGWLPIARLNIAFKESHRTFAGLIDQKWLVVPKYRRPPEPAPVRFYLEAWQRLLLSRVDQIAHCGFSGIAIEGTAAAKAISDHPRIEEEMQNWVTTVSQHFKQLGMGDRLVILRSESPLPWLPAAPSAIDGVIAPHVLTTPSGRFRKPWERAEPLKVLSALASRKKRILLLEAAQQKSSQRDRILQEALSHGFEADFIIPQGDHR